MKWKKVLTDPSFWILLIANVWLVYAYEQKPQLFRTLMWLYWSQSVLYGLFNFADMLTVPRPDMSTFSTTAGSWIASKVSLSFFFLFHYGFFHLAYFIFLIIVNDGTPFDWDLYKKFMVIFALFQVVSFVQHKIQDRKQVTNMSSMFALPYLRIVPMHLCILLPAFIHVTGLTVFLVLKVFADVIMYIATTNYYKKQDPVASATMVNLDSTFSSNNF